MVINKIYLVKGGARLKCADEKIIELKHGTEVLLLEEKNWWSSQVGGEKSKHVKVQVGNLVGWTYAFLRGTLEEQKAFRIQRRLEDVKRREAQLEYAKKALAEAQNS